MTKGGPANSTSLLIYYVYQQAFQYNAFGYAAALASILVVLLLLVTLRHLPADARRAVPV